MSNRETELGTLIIVVLKARNLHDKHSFYKQDVFAQVTLNGTTKKTKVAVRGGQHPEWDEEIRYPVMKQSVDKFRKLEVACYAKEPRSDDTLGKGEVDITDTLKTGEFDNWVPLNVDGVVRGDLYLEMTFYSNDPAPTPPSAPSTPSSHSQRRPSKLERIDRPPQANPQPGAFLTRPLQPGRHPSGPLAPAPHNPIKQSRPAQHTSIPPLSDRLATATLHNLLSDPVTGQQPPNNVYYSSKDHYSRSSSASSLKRADSPLPALPHEATPPAGLPTTLLPGGARPHLQQTSSHPYTTSQLPSTLRAGVGRVVSSPNPSQDIPTHSQQASTSMESLLHHNAISMFSSQDYAPGPTPHHTLPNRNTQLTLGPTTLSFSTNSTTVQLPYGAPIAPVSTGSTHWPPEAPSTEPFSFPIPMPHTPASGELDGNYAPPPQASYTYIPPPAVPLPKGTYPLPPSKSGYPQSSYTPPTPQSTSQHWQQPSSQDTFSDPYLQARYMTPLPLPPGSGSPRRRSVSSSSVPTNPDQVRNEALQKMEREVEQRKTQEEKDRELALALDRELNLETESEPTPTAVKDNSEMPGGWSARK
ncbi:hypothetical protein C0995_004943 [Termitomyces sp. Mi166|nr:hypothetical protein C0995_004943 [Termitomyces sp. Mi166\